MKLALITGGSKGLGKSLSEKYLNEGFEVREFSRSGKSANSIRCDFSSPEDSAQIINETLSELSRRDFSRIDLINNIGTLNPIGPISEFEIESWIDHININLTSSVMMSGIFVKHFQNHSGKKVIATISSGAATKSKYGWSLYCTVKAGLEQFSRTLALEQNSKKGLIDTVIIDPGIVDTNMQATIRDTNERLFPELSRFIGFKEDGELENPATVAEKIYNILSGNIKNGAKYSLKEHITTD